jgi:CrcB protein
VSPGTWIGVALLGGAGSVGRALVTHAVAVHAGRGFPLGTFAVNLSGALALGVLVGAGVGTTPLQLAGAGLLGGFTTFSAWMVESEALGRHRRYGAAALNLAVSLLSGLGAVWLGRHVGAAL